MTARQKEIQGYVIIGLLIFSYWVGQVYSVTQKGIEHSYEMEQKTGKHWIMDLQGKPLGDTY